MSVIGPGAPIAERCAALLVPKIAGRATPTIALSLNYIAVQRNSDFRISTCESGKATKYRRVPGLLRKNYWMSEDGRRAGGIYVWAERADADRLYTDEWKKFVTGKYGRPLKIEYLRSPVMVDNREGSISVAP